MKMSKKYSDLAKKHNRKYNHSIIIGATTMEQLKENIDSVHITLSEEILAEVDELHRQQPNPNVKEV